MKLDDPMPWPMLVAVIAFWLYGFWPALYPEHFRRKGVQYAPRPLRPHIYPAGIIRICGVLWLMMMGVMLLAGIYSRL
jgi:hypothetical protein